MSKTRFFICLLVFAVLMKAPFIVRTPTDWDEGVYLALSQNMTWTLENYSTLNTGFDDALSLNLYRSPVFHHPPLIPFLIKVFSTVFTTLIAAKIVVLIFMFLSYFFIYGIASRLTDFKGVLTALLLWTICPIFNLETSLIHLDIPSAVFVLAGIWFFMHYQDHGHQRVWLFASAGVFALAMLTKYTTTIYITIPLCLMALDKESRKDKGTVVLFLLILSLGFSWWLYVFARFGSIAPEVFTGVVGKPFESPYLRSLLKRSWYHPWLYFIYICPLAIVYILGGFRYIKKIIKKETRLFFSIPDVRFLFAVNISSLVCVVLFGIANAFTNGYWIMRHNMPFFPVVYITLGYMVSALIDKHDKAVNAYLTIGLFVTAVSMSVSSFLTILNITSLKPIPPILFWVPGLTQFFY